MGSAEKKDSLTKQEVNEILKFGAENLFKDDEEGRVVYDDAAVEKLLCREQVGEVEKDFGMNEYLCSFKVASYQVKDTAEEEEEEQEEAIEEREEQEKKEEEAHYWERVLGDSYALHLGQLQREQEEIAKSLGKGKRIRKQINYAETMQDGMLKSIKKRGDEKEEKEEPEERVYDSDMETKYLSDYEPNSSDSEEDDEEDFVAEGDKSTTTKPQVKTKTPPVEMPPLLAKYKGNIEVLGFTARQRRSFLDTVMRFGMPPENVLKSQWMVRDLTKIAENAFKAYVSLFMRHLCEPISDNAQHFADGVPREGLSRQHVLTRIGMIALIRRKVHEFESVNHIISMNEFGTHPTEGEMKVGTDAAQYGKDSTKDGEKEGAEKDGENDDVVLLDSTKEGPKKDGKKEDKKDGESNDVVLLDSTKEEDKKDGEKEEDKKDGESDDVLLLDDTSSSSSQECPVTMTSEAEDKGKEDGKTKIVKDGEKDTAEVKKGSDEAVTGRAEESGQKGKRKEEEMEIEEDSKEEQEKIEPADAQKSSSKESRNEKVEDMETEQSVESKGGTDGEKGEKKASDVEEDKEKTAEMTVDEVEKEEKAASEKDITKTTSEKDKAKIAYEKDETEKYVEMDQKDKDAENETQGETEKEKCDKGDKTEVEPEDSGKSKDAADAEKTANKEKDIVEKEAEEEKQSAEKDAEGDDKQVEEKSEKADDGEVCDKKIEGTDEKTPEKAAEGEELVKTKCIIKKKEETDKDTEEINGNKTEAVQPKTLEEIMLELRRRFWIADGGFTDLHRLWVMEERGLVPGHEHEIWHRLHDYWLLAGIVTHGYRHWQDILGDPRFNILNHAFQSEGDKMRKAAFLNRRFQLIEQALVIEEQLRKALHESKLRQDSKKKLDSEDDGLSDLDNLAANLRRLNQGQPPLGSMSEKKLHNVLNTVSALVSDIKAMSYTSMPATLSKGLPPPVPTVPPMARMPMVGGVVVPVATQQPPLQQMSIPALPALTVKPRSTTAEESGVKDVICID